MRRKLQRRETAHACRPGLYHCIASFGPAQVHRTVQTTDVNESGFLNVRKEHARSISVSHVDTAVANAWSQSLTYVRKVKVPGIGHKRAYDLVLVVEGQMIAMPLELFQSLSPRPLTL